MRIAESIGTRALGRTLGRTLLALSLAGALACDSVTGIDDDIPGSYVATRLVAITDGDTVDALADGGSLHIELYDDGATEGELYIPFADEDGDAFVADLAGTWELTGGRVRFDHADDTFLRDMDFEVRSGGRLRGERTFSGTRVVVELERE